jgi:hypothetical protein
VALAATVVSLPLMISERISVSSRHLVIRDSACALTCVDSYAKLQTASAKSGSSENKPNSY